MAYNSDLKVWLDLAKAFASQIPAAKTVTGYGEP